MRPPRLTLTTEPPSARYHAPQNAVIPTHHWIGWGGVEGAGSNVPYADCALACNVYTFPPMEHWRSGREACPASHLLSVANRAQPDAGGSAKRARLQLARPLS